MTTLNVKSNSDNVYQWRIFQCKNNYYWCFPGLSFRAALIVSYDKWSTSKSVLWVDFVYWDATFFATFFKGSGKLVWGKWLHIKYWKNQIISFTLMHIPDTFLIYVKLLCIIIGSKLSWVSYIDAVRIRLSWAIFLLSKLKALVSKKYLMHAYH